MRISAVIVTYYPEPELLDPLLQSLAGQVTEIIAADNTPDGSGILKKYKNIQLIIMQSNKGIAAAQNAGIAAALNQGSDYILLSDQDTVFPENYVRDMISVFDSFADAAAVVPLFKDTNQKKKNQGFIKKGFIGFKKIFPESGTHEVFQAVASGKILRASALSETGLMKEELFIDWVDLEWCWRAVSKGYRIIGNADVVISHRLGDSALNLGFREVNLRSAVRHYYITRNAFYLALYDSHLDLPHRITLFLKSFRYLAAFPLLGSPHVLHLRLVIKGFLHGILGRIGPLV